MHGQEIGILMRVLEGMIWEGGVEGCKEFEDKMRVMLRLNLYAISEILESKGRL